MITRESLIILFGILVFVTPYLGIPTDWKNYLLAGVGILLMIIGYNLRYGRFLRLISRENGERATGSFVESDGEKENNPE